MTDQECRHVADLLAAHEALVHWCETSISAHADLVELTLKLKLEFATGSNWCWPRNPASRYRRRRRWLRTRSRTTPS